ncbi:MAG TPA: hypothetical protein VD994_12160, partial [Prosthecobacter sp.]|nr:hypothetical protein [Prosthecobacter sp.]
MADDLTLDLLTFDVGIDAGSPMAYAEAVMRQVEESWDTGADLVLLPEFLWIGLEPRLAKTHQSSALQTVSETFWRDLLPDLKRRVARPDKA